MKAKTLFATLTLALLLGTNLALPGTAAADGGWNDRGRDRHASRDWRHDHRYDRHDHGRYHGYWSYRGWYPYDRYNYRTHRHYRPVFAPDGSINLWIVIDD